jgi:hypothetical protein
VTHHPRNKYQYGFCRYRLHGLSLLDYSMLSLLAYFTPDSASSRAVMQMYSRAGQLTGHAKPSTIVELLGVLVAEDWAPINASGSPSLANSGFVDFYSPSRNLSVISVRGTNPLSVRFMGTVLGSKLADRDDNDDDYNHDEEEEDFDERDDNDDGDDGGDGEIQVRDILQDVLLFNAAFTFELTAQVRTWPFRFASATDCSVVDDWQIVPILKWVDARWTTYILALGRFPYEMLYGVRRLMLGWRTRAPLTSPVALQQSFHCSSAFYHNQITRYVEVDSRALPQHSSLPGASGEGRGTLAFVTAGGRQAPGCRAHGALPRRRDRQDRQRQCQGEGGAGEGRVASSRLMTRC